jgi:hypothetical protein
VFSSPLKLPSSLPLPFTLLLPLKFLISKLCKSVFYFLAICSVFVLFKALSISFFSFELKHLHCLFPSTCCMSALLAHALPSSPCVLVFAYLLHVRLFCPCFIIIALHACFCLCAYFRLLVACPPRLHLLHHHHLACLLPPSCYMSTLFAPISALPPCVTPFTHVLISTYLLHVCLVCTYSTITAMCACLQTIHLILTCSTIIAFYACSYLLPYFHLLPPLPLTSF